ncbi:MAG: hypothetical protein JWP92_1068 [Caulobacter sp.]|nr:hypothetical protein [Caulobacter sp.]
MEVRSAIFALFLMGAALAAAPARADDCAGRQGPDTLSVQVINLKAPTGEVVVTLYPSDPRRFLAPRGKLLRQRVKTTAPVTKACFYLPGPGTYAVAVYHDADANHDFNRSALGMPTEGFGFSNDAPTRFGVPSFDAVRFVAKAGDTPLRIKMRYGR